MAQVHLATTLTTTDNLSSYTTPAFTPGAGDLVVVIVTLADTDRAGAGGPDVSDSVSGAYFKVGVNPQFDTRYDPFRQHGIWSYLIQSSPTATSRTVTVDCGGVAQAGCTVTVLLVKNPTAYGTSAVRQSAFSTANANNDTSTTPAVTFGSTTLSTSVVVGYVGSRTPTGLSAPTTFDQYFNGAHATPDCGASVVGGFGWVGTALSWGGSAPRYAVVALELYNTGTPHVDPPDLPAVEAIGINSYEIRVLTDR